MEITKTTTSVSCRSPLSPVVPNTDAFPLCIGSCVNVFLETKFDDGLTISSGITFQMGTIHTAIYKHELNNHSSDY